MISTPAKLAQQPGIEPPSTAAAPTRRPSDGFRRAIVRCATTRRMSCSAIAEKAEFRIDHGAAPADFTQLPGK